MELFDEVVKVFPTIQKHARYLFQKIPPVKRNGSWKNHLAAEMIQWIWDELLDDHTILYHTFLRAGFTNKLDMSVAVFEWYLMEHQLQKFRQ